MILVDHEQKIQLILLYFMATVLKPFLGVLFSFLNTGNSLQDKLFLLLCEMQDCFE